MAACEAESQKNKQNKADGKPVGKCLHPGTNGTTHVCTHRQMDNPKHNASGPIYWTGRGIRIVE